MTVQRSDTLPTHIALTLRRINASSSDDSALRFLYVSYTFEAVLKTIALVLQAGLQRSARDDAYRIAYRLIRANGLGEFEAAIREVSSVPLVTFLPPFFRPMVAWCTKKRTKADDDWFREVARQTRSLFEALETDQLPTLDLSNVVNLLGALAHFRNKTKAHGALGDDFFTNVNPLYLNILEQLISTCPAFSWDWFQLTKTDKGNIRGILLRGAEPRTIPSAEASKFVVSAAGLHVVDGVDGYYVGDLLHVNREANQFLVTNGGYNDRTSTAEFIDYASGLTKAHTAANYTLAPATLPKSDTAALVDIDVQSNSFGNLPPLPTEYVDRPRLETQLRERLLDDNHTIITLHGRGGVGKTSLALSVAKNIADASDSRFEYIVWFSSRDIDLRSSGPARVTPDVADLESVAELFGRLFGRGTSLNNFAAILKDPASVSSSGILFIFDNFETVADATGFHQFLDTHTHLPNKVLITSRYRAFKADYPIEVSGMEFAEARVLIASVARKLGIEGLVDDKIIDSIFTATEGHAYVIRVLLGEMAKQGRYVPMTQLMAARSDIVDAVFERSFNSLSDAGRNVFLLMSNWQSFVSELSVVAILAQRGIDALGGIEECTRLSLIIQDETIAQHYYTVPKLARIFGKKKLKGDPDALQLQEDLRALHAFGTRGATSRDAEMIQHQVDHFVTWCNLEAGQHSTSEERLDQLLNAVAEFWPSAWLSVARFRQQYYPSSDIEYALRRAVEEEPKNVSAWLARAEYAQKAGLDSTYISSLVNAIEAAPEDLKLIEDVAERVGAYIDKHKVEIPMQRRGIYVATVRERMERLGSRLTATAFGRLAWLYLFEAGDNIGLLEKALSAAQRGLNKEPRNEHLLRLVERTKETLRRAYGKDH